MFDNNLFDICTETKPMEDGTIEISCKLGLWSVSGQDQQSVEREAKHYWRQYMADGEYDSLLA